MGHKGKKKKGICFLMYQGKQKNLFSYIYIYNAPTYIYIETFSSIYLLIYLSIYLSRKLVFQSVK